MKVCPYFKGKNKKIDGKLAFYLVLGVLPFLYHVKENKQ